MTNRTDQPKRQPPRDAKGRFVKRQPLPEALVKRLGQGRSVLATWLDDSIPWVVIERTEG